MAGLCGLGRAVMCLLLATAAGAQVRSRPMAFPGVDATGLATTLPAALRAMAAEAGVIFVGTVTGVRRVEGTGFGGVGVVEVRFQVEAAVRGVRGGSYTLREWAGLWPPGERGFVVGDRRLMLLHSPSAAGLSSPVGGYEGAIPITGAGVGVGPGTQGVAAEEPVVDLRWVAARVVRPAGEPRLGTVAGVSSSRVQLGEGATERAGEAVEVAGRAPVLVHGTLPASAISPRGSAGSAMPVTQVLALLRQWTGSGAVGR